MCSIYSPIGIFLNWLVLLIHDPAADTEDSASSVRTLLQAGTAELFDDYNLFMAQVWNT